MTSEINLDILLLQQNLSQLSAKEQTEAILNHPNAHEIIQKLPIEDLYLTVKRNGLVDSLELLEHFSPLQIQTCVDLDAWHKEELDLMRTADWLLALESQDSSKAYQTFFQLDFSFISLLLKKCAVILESIDGEIPYFESSNYSITPDQRYAVVFGEEEETANLCEFMRRALDDLYAHDMLFAMRLIESVRWDTQTLLDEESLHFRDNRLLDLGFLDRASTREILSYVDPDAHLPTHFEKRPDEDQIHWHLQAQSQSKTSLLKTGLEHLPQSLVLDLWHQAVATANRVHMAIVGDYSDPEQIERTGAETLNFIDMALGYLSRGDQAQLPQLLVQLGPQMLFKVGHSLALRLRLKMQKIRRHPVFALEGDRLKQLDAPLFEIAQGLLMPEPLFYHGLLDAKRVDYAPFSSLTELSMAAQAVNEICFRAALVGPKCLGLSSEPPMTHGHMLKVYLNNKLESLEPTVLQAELDVWVSKIASLAPLPGIKDADEARTRLELYVRFLMQDGPGSAQ